MSSQRKKDLAKDSYEDILSENDLEDTQEDSQLLSNEEVPSTKDNPDLSVVRSGFNSSEEAEDLMAEAAAPEEGEDLMAEAAAPEEAEDLMAEEAAREEAEDLMAEAVASEEGEDLMAEAVASEEGEDLMAEAVASEEGEGSPAKSLLTQDSLVEPSSQEKTSTGKEETFLELSMIGAKNSPAQTSNEEKALVDGEEVESLLISPTEKREKDGEEPLSGPKSFAFDEKTHNFRNLAHTKGESRAFKVSQRLFSGPVTSIEASLASSQNLRIAQDKILELEGEIERLRIQNEQLAAASEIFQKRCDSLSSKLSHIAIESKEKLTELKEEKKIFLKSLEEKSKAIDLLAAEKKQLERRVTAKIKKIGVRERELENRLELMKMEKSSMSRNKDEIILDTKSKLDKLSEQIESVEEKNNELDKQLEVKREALRRASKTLKLVLAMMEGEKSS